MAGGGNSIDRDAALQEVKTADSVLAEVPNATQELVDYIVETLSENVRVENGSSMHSMYEQLNEQLASFSQSIVSTMPTEHEKIIEAINAAGYTVGHAATYSPSDYGSCIAKSVPTHKDYGVKDYSEASSSIQDIVTKFGNIKSQLNDAIRCYKNLYAIAAESNYSALGEAANHAAEALRGVFNTLSEFISKFKTSFDSFISSTENKAFQTTKGAMDIINSIKRSTSQLESMNLVQASDAY